MDLSPRVLWRLSLPPDRCVRLLAGSVPDELAFRSDPSNCCLCDPERVSEWGDRQLEQMNPREGRERGDKGRREGEMGVGRPILTPPLAPCAATLHPSA